MNKSSTSNFYQMTKLKCIMIKLERIQQMTEQEERKLCQSLNLKSKSEIINLFIKLRKMFDKSQERLYRVEQELNDKTNLEDLLENIVDR